MDDAKKVYRQTEQDAKEAGARVDGDEDLKDQVGNAGDEVRKDLGNAGDDMKKTVDRETQPTPR